MDFAHPIAIIITRPFLHSMAYARVPGMHIPIVRRLIGIEDCPLGRHIPFYDATGGRFVGVLQYPVAHLMYRAADHTQNRRSVVVIGTLTSALHPEGTRRVGAAGRPR